MIRTESIYIHSSDNLSRLCHLSKNLYNEANYLVREKFFETGKWMRYYKLCNELQTSENYRELPAQSAQQTLRAVDSAWKAFFASMKAWKKNPITGMPRPPGYKPKNGEYVLMFTNQQIRVRDGNLKLPAKVGLEMRTRLGNDTALRYARIVPLGIGYDLEIVYEKCDVPLKRETPTRIAGIDLGVNNLATIGSNIAEPIVIKGGAVKSMNQYYNKKQAMLRSIYARQDIKTGAKLERLRLKRNRKVKDFMHKASKAIIDWCEVHDIDTIVIGKNDGWKQKVNLGRVTNQHFVGIPFYRLIAMIEYKAEERGIQVIKHEESYTSKCSFFDHEPIAKHEVYAGKRVKRGLFRTGGGTLVNADLNAAYNIIKKAIPEAFADGIEGLGVVPRRLNTSELPPNRGCTPSAQTIIYPQNNRVLVTNMIYGFEYSTDARDSHVVVKKFQSEAAAKRWRDEKREAFAYPGAATHSVPAYQQNWHHKIRQLYRFEGRIPAAAMHWIRARVQDSFGSMYSETVNQGVMNYVAVHGEEIK